MTLAGTLFALAVRLGHDPDRSLDDVPAGPAPSGDPPPASDGRAGGLAGQGPPERVHARWPLLVCAAAALVTAAAGAWASLDGFGHRPLSANLRALTDGAHLRLLLHVLGGLVVVVLPLAIVAATRPSRRRLAMALVLALLAAFALQAWLGVLMLFDSRSGPLTGYAG